MCRPAYAPQMGLGGANVIFDSWVQSADDGAWREHLNRLFRA